MWCRRYVEKWQRGAYLRTAHPSGRGSICSVSFQPLWVCPLQKNWKKRIERDSSKGSRQARQLWGRKILHCAFVDLTFRNTHLVDSPQSFYPRLTALLRGFVLLRFKMIISLCGKIPSVSPGQIFLNISFCWCDWTRTKQPKQGWSRETGTAMRLKENCATAAILEFTKCTHKVQLETILIMFIAAIFRL